MGKIQSEDFRKEVSTQSKERGIIHSRSPAGRAIRTKPEIQLSLKL